MRACGLPPTVLKETVRWRCDTSTNLNRPRCSSPTPSSLENVSTDVVIFYQSIQRAAVLIRTLHNAPAVVTFVEFKPSGTIRSSLTSPPNSKIMSSPLSGIDVEGDLEFLNQNRRAWDMHHGPGNLQMLHHHPFESYGLVMDNVPGYGILPPGPRPSTSSAVPNYPYNQPQSQPQHPTPGHSGRDRERECDRERERERDDNLLQTRGYLI